MENYLQSAMNQSQGRAPNTIKLRQMYNDYKINEESAGNQSLSFEDWAKQNYPDMKILSQ